jgi:hypothetical protein
MTVIYKNIMFTINHSIKAIYHAILTSFYIKVNQTCSYKNAFNKDVILTVLIEGMGCFKMMRFGGWGVNTYNKSIFKIGG